MHVVVTGAAGFIGSTLTDRLLAEGHSVTGIDSFSEYYGAALKRRNLDAAMAHAQFRLVNDDLLRCSLEPLLEGVQVVFHLAAQPGVRLSWDQFARYERDNVLGTQRLLDALRGREVRFVYASSSSVYGEADRYPVLESDLPKPQSPYGVSKLAAEHLCGVYARNWGLETIALRYFTVFGPRQRPDMAFHRLIECGLSGEPFPLLGTGEQIRDFTYVDDIVEANLRAAFARLPSPAVLNIANQTPYRLLDAIEVVERALGRELAIDRLPPASGDVTRTGGNADLALQLLGWRARTPLEEGLHRQIDWHRQLAL